MPRPNGKLFVYSRQTARPFNPTTGVWDSAVFPTNCPSPRIYPAEGSSVLLTLSPS